MEVSLIPNPPVSLGANYNTKQKVIWLAVFFVAAQINPLCFVKNFSLWERTAPAVDCAFQKPLRAGSPSSPPAPEPVRKVFSWWPHREGPRCWPHRGLSLASG